MPLNIKDESVHAQARRLASLTGVSITAAVRDAVARQLDQVEQARRTPEPARSSERLLGIARICAQALKGSELSSDHSDLYDGQGLPR